MSSATRLGPLLRLNLRRFSTSTSLPRSLPAEIRFLPRILQPTTYIPNWSHRRTSAEPSKPKEVKPWNPATWFIWMFLFIGSEAIHTINLKRGHADFMVKTESKIARLKEVLERIQNGEEVDVEKLLGTGNPTEEAEWAEVMKELEEHGEMWHTRRAQEGDAAKDEDGTRGQPEKSEVKKEIPNPNRNLTAKDFGL